jgi:hypothetical protein
MGRGMMDDIALSFRTRSRLVRAWVRTEWSGRPGHRWTTVGGRVTEPVLYPPLSMPAAEAEAA